MKKKGELLNQLAIISDLMENINLEAISKTVLLDVNKVEFDKVYKIVIEKTKIDIPNDGSVFTVKIGDIDFVFNMSNA